MRIWVLMRRGEKSGRWTDSVQDVSPLLVLRPARAPTLSYQGSEYGGVVVHVRTPRKSGEMTSYDGEDYPVLSSEYLYLRANW
jgi:hypothetical protein